MHWGDGSRVQAIAHRRTHIYLRPGRYRLRVTVVDRAGNATTTLVVVRIVPAPKRKPKKKKTPGGVHG